MSSRREKSIFRKVRNANLKYGLIASGDRVAVGVSGGKDSYCLLYFLQLLQKYTPLTFELYPIYIDLGWENDPAPLYRAVGEMGLSLIREKTGIARAVFHTRREKNPCALCSHLRRGALNRVASEHHCNKVALGHHLDDVVNTLFLSIMYESRFNVFKPSTYLDRQDLHVIRPLIYVPEKEISAFVRARSFSTLENPCPAAGRSKRSEVDQWLDCLEQKYPPARQNLLKALENVNVDCFWDPSP